MKLDTSQWVRIARTVLIAALAIASILGYDLAIIQPREIVVQEEAIKIAAEMDVTAPMLAGGVSHFTEIEADTLRAAAPTAIGTATPALMADSLGVSNLFEVRDAATPVAYVADGGDATLTGALTAADVTTTDDASVGDDLTVSGLVNWGTVAVTVTNGLYITPTATFYDLSAAGAVTLTLGASCNQGQPLVMYGDDNQTITIADTNIYTTDGNAATLGQYDTILWVCDNNTWIHVAKSANS